MSKATRSVGIGVLSLLASSSCHGARHTHRMAPQATLQAMFDALAAEDLAHFQALTTPDLRLYDGGRILDREGLFNLVRDAHKAGQRLVWSITQGRLSQGGSVAVLSYINRGSMGTAEAPKPMAWLEVASFRHEADGWKVEFLESQRMSGPDPSGAT